MATQQKAGEDILASDIIDPTVVYKAASEVVNNSSALQNDDELFVALAIGLWRIEAIISHTSANTTPDIKTNWTFSGTVGNNTKNCVGGNLATATTMEMTNLAYNTFNNYGSQTTSQFIREEIFLEVTAAGTLQLQWAQNTATAVNTTVQSASRLYVTQVFV